MNTSTMKQLFLDKANILFQDCAIASTDAANYYDTVNHAVCSISLQAVGVGTNFIPCFHVIFPTNGIWSFG